MTDINLEGEQVTAYDTVMRYINSTTITKQVLKVFGLAGTGKSTLLGHIAKKTGLAVVAPTGKAAQVIRSKGVDAETIHHTFLTYPHIERKWFCPTEMKEYTFLNGETACPGCATAVTAGVETILRFKDRRYEDGALDGETFLVDESSMVGLYNLGNVMFATGARFVAFGDPGQLPPVKDTPAFVGADVMLTDIRRQCRDIGIYKQARVVRDGHMYSDDNGFYVRDGLTDRDLLKADIHICHTNKTRIIKTKMIRSLLGFGGLPPRKGEPVVYRGNNRLDSGLARNEGFTLAEDFDPAYPLMVLKNWRGEVIKVRKAYVVHDEDKEPMPKFGYQPDMVAANPSPFRYGYVLTAHTAQGSEYDQAVVWDEFPKGHAERRNWIYTAITRAKERAIVIRPPR